MTRVYLLGDDTPIWITEPSDIFIGRLEHAHPNAMLAVTIINWSPGDEHEEYSEGTAFVRVDQVTLVAPLWRKVRDQIADAKADA